MTEALSFQRGQTSLLDFAKCDAYPRLDADDENFLQKLPHPWPSSSLITLERQVLHQVSLPNRAPSVGNRQMMPTV